MMMRGKIMHDMVAVAVIGGDSHAYKRHTCTYRYTDAVCTWMMMVVPMFIKA